MAVVTQSSLIPVQFHIISTTASRSATLPTITAGQQRFQRSQPVSIASNDHSRPATLQTITAGKEGFKREGVNGGSNSVKLNTSTVSHYFNHSQPVSNASNDHSRSATLPTITAGQHRFQPSQPVSNALKHSG